MLLLNWLAEWKRLGRLAFTKKQKSRRQCLRAMNAPNQAEVLEDRTLLTAFVVDTLADVVASDGMLSLREAIQAANTNTAVNEAAAGMADGDSITFDASIAGGTISLTLGQLSVIDDVTIDGDGGTTDMRITIDAGGSSRVFNVDVVAGVFGTVDLVTLNDLVLTNGMALNGGGIFAASDLTLDNTDVTNSTVTGVGGGIASQSGDLTIQNGSLISGNSATVNAGGVFSQATLTVIDSTISDNTAAVNGGGIFSPGTLNVTGATIAGNTAGVNGGGIFSPGTLNVTGATIAGNTANGTGVNGGGGIFFDNVVNGTATIDGGTIIQDNRARIGGGIFNNRGTTVLDGSIVTGNTATLNGGGIGHNTGALMIQNGSVISSNTASSNGGGIFNQTIMTIDNSTVSLNSSGAQGGGIITAAGSTTTIQGGSMITGNTAGTNGGGILNQGVLSVDGSTIGNFIVENDVWSSSGTAAGDLVFVFVDTQNSTTGTDVSLDVLENDGTTAIDMNNAGISAGGTVAQGGSVFYNLLSPGSANEVTPYNIYASVVDPGAAIAEMEDNDPATGMAQAITEETLVTGGIGSMTDVDVYSITALAGASLVVMLDSMAGTAAVVEILDTDGTTVLATGTVDAFSLDNAAIAAGLAGGTYFIRITGNAGATGGYRFVAQVVDPIGDRVLESEPNNTPANADGLLAGEFGQGNLLNIGGNTADSGGGIFNETSGTVTVTNLSVISNNTATGNAATQGGGGIYNDGGMVRIEDSSRVSFNVASGTSGSGGGVFNNGGGLLQVLNATLEGNTANRAGGGIEDNASTTSLIDSTLDGNVAGPLGTANPGNGGGLHVTGASTVVISGGNILNNTAAAEGGGLWNSVTGDMTIQQSAMGGTLIEGNVAQGNGTEQGGGGVFNDGGTVDIVGATINLNVSTATAVGNGGGGIFNLGELNLTGTDVTNNMAINGSASGGGILNSTGGILTVNGGSISNNTTNRAGGGIEDASNVDGVVGVTLTNVNLDNNVAQGSMTSPGNGGGLHVTGLGDVTITGGTVNGNLAALEGGGLWNGSGFMSINGTTINGNTASGNGADDGGGGIFNNGGEVNTNATTMITNNVANGTSGSGGGVFNNNGIFVANGTAISTNTANRAGGGLEAVTGQTILNDITMIANVAGPMGSANPGNGGGLHLTGAGTVTISGGSITNNTAAAEGGGVWNSATGDMTIQQSGMGATLIQGNVAQGDGTQQGGGGVFNDGGTLDIVGANINMNISTATMAGNGGGGIFNLGTMGLTGVNITNNTAANAGGGGILNSTTGVLTINAGNIAGNTALNGGGVFNDGGTAMVQGATIFTNTATGNAATNGGGGIYLQGGMVSLNSATMVTNNIANGTSGSGGGIFNNGGILTATGTTITGNTANRAGGGIEANLGTTNLTNVTLNNNLAGPMGTAAPGNGGGLHITGAGNATIIGGTVNNNTAALEGGGLWNGSGLMTIDGTTIIGNTARGNGADDGGGGVFNNGGTVTTSATVMITNNVANGTSGSGGGIFNNGGTVTATGTNITNNTANRAGGGIEALGGTTTLNLIVLNNNVAGNGAANPGNGGGLHITGAGNATIIGGTVNGNSAALEGGGLWNGSGTMTISGTTINGNTASGDAVDDGGGGIFNNGGTLTTDATVIVTNNIADGTSGAGGGLFNNGGTMTVTGTTVGSNTAFEGGGIYNLTGMLTIQNNALITGNSATEGGGGISTDDAMILNDSTVSSNTAGQFGGGIDHCGGDVTITNSTIADNTAIESNGGGLAFTDGSSTLVIRNSTFSGNSAGGNALVGGGGLANFSLSTLIENSTFVGNTTGGPGGGIDHAFNGDLTILNSTISGNTAAEQGGGMYILGTGSSRFSVVINNSTITLNQAVTGGGIFYEEFGTSKQNVTLNSTLVAENSSTFPGDVRVSNATIDGAFNLIGVVTDPIGITNGVDGNIIGTAANPVDPLLGPLANNGGPTLTHTIAPDSPAVNNGLNFSASSTDQRGGPFVRTFGSQTDIGALELQAFGGGGNDIIAIAPGGGNGVLGIVTVLNAITQDVLFNLEPYPDFFGGVRVAVGDVNGDMTPDIITGAGPGGESNIRVFDGTNGSPFMSFFAFPGFFGGVFVASADLDGDDNDDIIVGQDAGTGSRVRVFSGADGSELFNFSAYEPGFIGGARVAAGDITGDGTPDIITGAGPGGGPHVRVFDGATPQVGGGLGTDIGGGLGSFFAYEQGFIGGVFVAAADINDDGRVDLITGAGDGGGPHVRVFDGMTEMQLAEPLGSFFAFDVSFAGGVRVSASDITGDGIPDIIVAAGPGGGPHVRAFDSTGDPTADDIRSVFVGDPNSTAGLFIASSADLNGAAPLRLAEGFAPVAEAGTLAAPEVAAVFQAALDRLELAGASAEVIEALAGVTIEVRDLAGNRLALAQDGVIRLDSDASGVGWFVDPTPEGDEEFAADTLNALDPSAQGRVDLLTVILHELLHQVGADDLEAGLFPHHLMAETLPPSERRLPNSEDLDRLFSDASDLDSLLN